MPSFVSDRGFWHPAKENIGLTYKGKEPIPREKLPDSVHIAGAVLNPGDPFIYDGPDRGALIHIQRDNQGQIPGRHFRHDTEFLQAVRNRQFNSVDEFLKVIGYDELDEKKKFEEKMSRIQAHEVPKKVAAIEVLGGGRDFSGQGMDVVGEFTEAPMDGPKRARQPQVSK